MFYKRLLILGLIFNFFISLNIFSQTGSIKGFIKEDETGEPVIFTSVYLQGTQYGAISDINGYYVISKVPVGTYILVITYMGFDSINIPVELKNGDIITENLKLKKSNISLKEINISAEKEEYKTETKTSVVKITPKIISQIPSIGGQPDLAQYLQVLPGVIFTGDQGGQLYIRGGSPIQNKVGQFVSSKMIRNIVGSPTSSINLQKIMDEGKIIISKETLAYLNRLSSVLYALARNFNYQADIKEEAPKYE